MKKYSKPILEEVILELDDVITASNTLGGAQPGDKNDDSVWPW